MFPKELSCSPNQQRSKADESVVGHSQLMFLWLRIITPLSLSSLPLVLPLFSDSHYRCWSQCRCCLESFLPYTSTSPSLTDVVWHTATRPCLPLFFCLSSTSLLPDTSLSLSPSADPLFFTRFCLSLHLLFLPISLPLSTPLASFPPSLPLHTPCNCSCSQFLLFPPVFLWYISSILSLSLHLTLQLHLSQMFLDTEMISPVVIMKLKSLLRQKQYLLFGLGGSSQ